MKMSQIRKRDKAIKVIEIIIVGFLLSVYFYSQLINMEIPIHSDDVATASDLRDHIDMGCTWNQWIQPLSWINKLLYIIFGPTELFLQLFFAFKYCVCISLALYLALYNEKKMHWWMLPFFIFFCMPGNFGDASIHPLKFHVWTLMVPLICLAFILMKGNDISRLKKRDIFFLIGFSIFGICERDILVIVYCWIPFVLYWIIYFWQKGYITKYLKWLIVAVMAFLIAGRVFFSNVHYQGYGASRFVPIEDIEQNLIFGITGLLSMLNIDIINSNILQYTTIIYFIRLVLVGFSIGCIVSRVREIHLKKLENVSIVDAILSISALVVVVAYLFGGIRDSALGIRYASYLYYIFIIVSCRKLYEIVHLQQFDVGIRKYKVNLLSMFFIVCIFSLINPVAFVREKNDRDILAEQVEKIDNLSYGVGSFWVAGVTSCLTDFHTEIQAVEWKDETMEPYLNIWDCYRSGNKYFNYFIEDSEYQSFGVTMTNLQKTYGYSIKKYPLNGANIYLYDYDIRTIPLLIDTNESVYKNKNDHLEIKNQSFCLESGDSLILDQLYLTVGKTKISVSGDFGEKLPELVAMQDVKVTLEEVKEGMVIYEISTDKLYDNLELKLNNKSESLMQIRKICLERIENSIPLSLNSEQQLSLTPGYYIFAAEGENIKNSKMIFEMNGEIIQAERINNGRKKVAYGVQVEYSGNLKINASYKGAVQEVFYQNEIQSSFHNPNKMIYTIKQGIKIKGAEGLLYGPYVTLQPGNYQIDIIGKGLNLADIRFLYGGGVAFENAMLIQNSPEHYIYQINVTEEIDLFEVLISDIRKDNLKFYYYTIGLVDGVRDKVNLNYRYDMKDIHVSEEAIFGENNILLKEGDFCYGPYVDLLNGKYLVTIDGHNLSLADIHITTQNGKNTIDYLSVNSENSDKIKIQFELEEMAENVEIVIRNTGTDQIVLKNYNISAIE